VHSQSRTETAAARCARLGILLVGTLWALFTGFAAIGGGILAPITSGYLVLIFLAGFLAGRPGHVVDGVLCGQHVPGVFRRRLRRVAAARRRAPYAAIAWRNPGLDDADRTRPAAPRRPQCRRTRRQRSRVRASEDKFRALFAAMRHVVLVLAGDGRVWKSRRPTPIRSTGPNPSGWARRWSRSSRPSWPPILPSRSASLWPPTGRTSSITASPSATASCGFTATLFAVAPRSAAAGRP